MRGLKSAIGLAAVAFVSVLSSLAPAQATYDFVTDNGNGSYVVLPNGTVTAQIFFRETLANAQATSLLAAEDGLFSTVVMANRLAAAAPNNPATITAANKDATNFNDLNDSSASGDRGTAGGTRSLGASTGPAIILVSPTERRISVGSFTIQGGLIPLQTTTFTIGDRPGTSDTLTFAQGIELDPQIVNRTFSVSVLPEPTCLGAIGFAGLILLRRVRR